MIDRSWPCLDFTKTAGWEARDRSDDDFDSFAAVVKWSVNYGTLGTVRARRLRSLAKRGPRAAARVLSAAVELRALLYRIFASVGRDERPAVDDIRALNRKLSKLMQHGELVPSPTGYRWAWREVDALESVLWPIIGSAAELLTSSDLGKVKLCAADGCGWLFIDASRNRSRRWCDMSGCGNRAKARRYRQRHREAD